MKNNNGHRWTNEEIKSLMILWANGVSMDNISLQLNVTKHAILHIVQRLRKHGVPLARRRSGRISGRHGQLWTQSEVEYLLRRRGDNITLEQIGTELGRSHLSLQSMIQNLRQQGINVPLFGSGRRKLWNTDDLKAFQVESTTAGVIQFSEVA